MSDQIWLADPDFPGLPAKWCEKAKLKVQILKDDKKQKVDRNGYTSSGVVVWLDGLE